MDPKGTRIDEKLREGVLYNLDPKLIFYVRLILNTKKALKNSVWLRVCSKDKH